MEEKNERKRIFVFIFKINNNYACCSLEYISQRKFIEHEVIIRKYED